MMRNRESERQPNSAAAQRRRRRRRRQAIVAGAVVGVCAISTGAAFAVTSRSGEQFRTTTATGAPVEQTVSAVGTVASATRYDRAFSVAGTVGSVDVSVGQTVTAGQTLASLDLTSLQDAVDEATTTLTNANTTLTNDLAAQTSGSATTSSTTGTGGGGSSNQHVSFQTASRASASPTASGTPTGGTPDIDTAVAAVTAAQQKMLDQDAVVTQALDASSTSIANSTKVCKKFTDASGSDDSSTTIDPTSTPDPTASAGSGTDDALTDALADCQTAITAAQADQQTVTDAQSTLMTYADDLDKAVQQAQAAFAAASTDTGGGTGGGGATGGGDTDTGGQGTGGQGTGGQDTGGDAKGTGTTGGTTGDTGTGSVPSAADILADQAAVTAAQAQLDIANSNLTMSTLTTPIAGTVAAVGMAAGDSVTASSTSQVITVIGADGYTVSTTIPLTSIDSVSVGQRVAIDVNGVAKELTGKVTSVGIVNVSNTSTPSYDVTVAVDGTSQKLFDGSSAQLAITIASTNAKVTVPTSAVHRNGTKYTVSVPDGDTTKSVAVEVGAVGAERTEITSGLSAGDTVVLADMNAPMSSDTSTSNSGLTGLSGSTNEKQFTIQGGPGDGPPAMTNPAG